MSKLLKMWRLFLPLFFLFVLVHFLKDITQDVLRIKTPIDVFGDVKEDVSKLSSTAQNLYLYGLGGLSFLAEAFLLISIPIVLKKNILKTRKICCCYCGFTSTLLSNCNYA